jgi:regulator of replication initiation timing
MSQAIEQTTNSSRGATHVPGRSPHTADILDRLARLRLVLPALGQELATARREAAKLRLENGRLKDRLHSLEGDGGMPTESGMSKTGR